MNVPLWMLLTAPPVIGALGFFIGVRFMAGKVADDRNLNCRNCRDVEWTCEDHRDTPWSGLTNDEPCCGGAGAPCRVCNFELATSGIRYVLEQAHTRCADSRNILLARIDRLKSIAASQQSVKSGRIVAVLEGGE